MLFLECVWYKSRKCRFLYLMPPSLSLHLSLSQVKPAHVIAAFSIHPSWDAFSLSPPPTPSPNPSPPFDAGGLLIVTPGSLHKAPTTTPARRGTCTSSEAGYVQHMSQVLNRRRFESQTYVKRETNDPRNKAEECIWNNPTDLEKIHQDLHLASHSRRFFYGGIVYSAIYRTER